MIIDIESPYGGGDEDTVKRNILYARMACRFAIAEGHTPIASHLLYTQPGILDDGNAEQRLQGIAAGKHVARACAGATWLFTDLGTTDGMLVGRRMADKDKRPAFEAGFFEESMEGCTFDELFDAAVIAGIITLPYARRGW